MAGEASKFHAVFEREHYVASRLGVAARNPGAPERLIGEELLKACLGPFSVKRVIRLRVKLVHQLDECRNVTLPRFFHRHMHAV